jgi:hypothetical protein
LIFFSPAPALLFFISPAKMVQSEQFLINQPVEVISNRDFLNLNHGQNFNSLEKAGYGAALSMTAGVNLRLHHRI